jgi:hypothetical protein
VGEICHDGSKSIGTGAVSIIPKNPYDSLDDTGITECKAYDTERSHAPLMKAADAIFMPTAYDRRSVGHKI